MLGESNKCMVIMKDFPCNIELSGLVIKWPMSNFSLGCSFFHISPVKLNLSLDQIWLPRTNELPLKIGHPRRKLVFQPSIFRCENASLREGYNFQNGIIVKQLMDCSIPANHLWMFVIFVINCMIKTLTLPGYQQKYPKWFKPCFPSVGPGPRIFLKGSESHHPWKGFLSE